MASKPSMPGTGNPGNYGTATNVSAGAAKKLAVAQRSAPVTPQAGKNSPRKR